MADIQVNKRFFAAANWATELHAARGARTPSVAQVLGVASLVLGDGGTNREAIAGMIVDAARGVDLAPREVRQRVGKKAARLVAACTDALSDPERLETEPDPSVVRVCAAVTVRDVQDLLRDVRRHGSVAFARHDEPPNRILERYRALVAVFRRRLGRVSALTPELRSAVAELERDSELETAIAAWRVSHVDAA
ncbi:MAG TPA: HD domain-containing protein [Acidimicrobiia bacterium]|nr:HD domain-containing protein [Acidimicrobiia bacterium]